MHQLLSRCTNFCPDAPTSVPMHQLVSRCTNFCMALRRRNTKRKVERIKAPGLAQKSVQISKYLTVDWQYWMMTICVYPSECTQLLELGPSLGPSMTPVRHMAKKIGSLSKRAKCFRNPSPVNSRPLTA
jgi:hypothetical protein